MSQSNLKHLERIKEGIQKHPHLSEEEKSNSMRHIEEWYREDQAWGTFIEKLSEVSPKIKALLMELGLL
jgi:DNA phosphorothioation-dependent restriction protein DptG